MQSRHGSLEGSILSVLWELESKGECSISVLDVCNVLNERSDEKRAYTTIKTVMDRLFEKNILYRYKPSNKFFYRTVYSRAEMVKNAVDEIANRYCNGDYELFMSVLKSNSISETEILVGVS